MILHLQSYIFTNTSLLSRKFANNRFLSRKIYKRTLNERFCWIFAVHERLPTSATLPWRGEGWLVRRPKKNWSSEVFTFWCRRNQLWKLNNRVGRGGRAQMGEVFNEKQSQLTKDWIDLTVLWSQIQQKQRRNKDSRKVCIPFIFTIDDWACYQEYIKFDKFIIFYQRTNDMLILSMICPLVSFYSWDNYMTRL